MKINPKLRMTPKVRMTPKMKTAQKIKTTLKKTTPNLNRDPKKGLTLTTTVPAIFPFKLPMQY